MRLSRFLMLCGVTALTACESDDITEPDIPDVAQVRFINALSDTGSVDIRAIDQVAYSPVANTLPYRGGTLYFPTSGGDRRFRVFPASTNIGITSQIILDATVNIPTGTRITLLLTGSARADTDRFVVINDDTQAPAAGQISVRMVNASTGGVDGYLVNAPADPVTGSPTFANVATLAASSYVGRPTGAAAVHATDPGVQTARASQAGPAAPSSLPGDVFPAAGVTSAGTAFSVYYFPPGVAGSPQAGVTNPSLVWFVDRNPCDAGC